jgi:hypothetical protein
MRRGLLVGAASLVLLANAWCVWQAARNRAEASGGALQLTGREVPPQANAFESSVTVLRLNWRTDESDPNRPRAPAWLDTNKIAELGFDCSLPLSSPQAQRHYQSAPSRRVFLALEYQVETSAPTEKPGRANTRLVVVDADRDAQRLRERHPDPRRHIVCRGLVGLTLRRHDRAGAPLSAPRLEARIEGICPSLLSVPKPANRLLLTPRRTGSHGETRPGDEPGFSALVRWGRNFEPWVDEIRPLGR